MRQPLVGYNHSVPYKGRMYHVQTEDSGPAKAHLFSHLFFKGMIISTAYATYEPEEEKRRVAGQMKEQHKSLMKQLVRGELDDKIAEMLGTVMAPQPGAEPQEAEKRIRSYAHKVKHMERVYAIQTFFFSTVATDVFFERTLIANMIDDCSERLPAGSPAVEKAAQAQHKEMMRKLRDGVFDERIGQLLGSLAPRPQKATPEAVRPRVLEDYRHRIRRDDVSIDVRTKMLSREAPHVISELFHEGRLLTTAEFFSYEELADEADAVNFAKEVAQQQHIDVLKRVSAGEFDQLIRKLVAGG